MMDRQFSFHRSQPLAVASASTSSAIKVAPDKALLGLCGVVIWIRERGVVRVIARRRVVRVLDVLGRSRQRGERGCHAPRAQITTPYRP